MRVEAFVPAAGSTGRGAWGSVQRQLHAHRLTAHRDSAARGSCTRLYSVGSDLDLFAPLQLSYSRRLFSEQAAFRHPSSAPGSMQARYSSGARMRFYLSTVGPGFRWNLVLKLSSLAALDLDSAALSATFQCRLVSFGSESIRLEAFCCEQGRRAEGVMLF